MCNFAVCVFDFALLINVMSLANRYKKQIKALRNALMIILFCLGIHQIATCVHAPSYFSKARYPVPPQLHAWAAVHRLTKSRPNFSGRKSLTMFYTCYC